MEVSLLFNDEARRWLKALKIAKIIFQDQGFHTLHLERMEKFIRRKVLYSQNIRDDYLPVLSRISASKNLPMTRLVNEIIKNYLTEKEAL